VLKLGYDQHLQQQEYEVYYELLQEVINK